MRDLAQNIKPGDFEEGFLRQPPTCDAPSFPPGWAIRLWLSLYLNSRESGVTDFS